MWLTFGIVAILEPLFQVAVLPADFPSWAAWYLGIHLFAFNLMQLGLFRRFDFVTMYVFRLVYYVWWHVVWGQLRLEWLF